MSKVDDELTRRLRRAERPVDDEGLFEGLTRRRSRRERARKVQAGVLAFAVLAATAGGFVALRSAFDGSDRDTGGSPILAANGEIVFSRMGDDGRFHLYAAQPDGSSVRQVTDDATNDTDPAVSPDGETIAFVHELDQGIRVIATVPIAGGTVTWQTREEAYATDPAWSPDGTRIVFVGHSIDSAVLSVADVDGSDLMRLPVGLDREPATPVWSPDGARIAFALREVGGAVAGDWTLATIDPDGSDLAPLVVTGDGDTEAPAWSPDGSRIASLRDGEGGHEIWTTEPDGSDAQLLAIAVEASLEPDLAWAPDGSALLVSDGEWIYRVDATPEGDPRANFVQLMEGTSPSWQPLPVVSGLSPTPTPTPEPSVSPEPEQAGHDIGLSFRLCHLHPLGGIDFLGDATEGKAWTGSPVTEEGRCSSRLDPTHVVAVDVTGDGSADAVSEPLEFCQFCRPFAAVDFDADGDDELAVLIDGGTVSSFLVYSVTAAGDAPTVAPLLIAPPGHPAAGREAGEPFMISSGGDEGYSAWVRCEGFPAAPVLVNTWRDAPIDGDVMEVHETAFVLRDGAFHVVDTTDYEAAVGPIPNVSDAPACGVDWQLWV